MKLKAWQDHDNGVRTQRESQIAEVRSAEPHLVRFFDSVFGSVFWIQACFLNRRGLRVLRSSFAQSKAHARFVVVSSKETLAGVYE